MGGRGEGGKPRETQLVIVSWWGRKRAERRYVWRLHILMNPSSSPILKEGEGRGERGGERERGRGEGGF